MSGPKVTLRTQSKFLAIIDQGQWVDLSNFAALLAATSGTGATAAGPRRAVTASGATAGSTASLRTHTEVGGSSGQDHEVIDWSKKIVLHAICASVDATTNGISRMTLGKGTGTGVGALASKGVGIQIEDLALKGVVHDGTTGATVDLSTALVDDRVYAVTIVSDGSGNVEWFLDGTSKGTSSGGPSGLAMTGACLLQMEVDNGADAAAQGLVVHDVKVYVEQ